MHQSGVPPELSFRRQTAMELTTYRAPALRVEQGVTDGTLADLGTMWGQGGKRWASTFRLRRQWCPWPGAASAIWAVQSLKEDPLKTFRVRPG